MYRSITAASLLPGVVFIFLATCVETWAQIPIGYFVDNGPLTINTPASESSPSLTGDGILVFASSNSSSPFYESELNQDGTYETASPISSVVEVNGENHPEISQDGLTLYFVSERPGGEGDRDIYQATRSSFDDPFTNVFNLGPSVNSPSSDAHPSISADGLRLYFARGSNMYVAKRQGVDMPFGDAEDLGLANAFGGGVGPTISNDELTLIFHSARDDKKNSFRDLFVATRDSIDEAFGPAVNLDDYSLGSRINRGDRGALTTPELSADWPAPGSQLIYTAFTNDQSNQLYGATWVAGELPHVVTETDGPEYAQDFDSLRSNGRNSRLPDGWSVVTQNSAVRTRTSERFPLGPTSIPMEAVYNAGAQGDDDRALAISVTNGNADAPPFAGVIQFVSKVANAAAKAIQFEFDLEVWDAAIDAVEPGLAALDISLDVDNGEGFQEVHSFGVAELSNLSRPSGDVLDANSMNFMSDLVTTDLPEGTSFRIRWSVPNLEVSQGWIFGIDNFSLNLFGLSGPDLDCDGDGDLDLLDVNCTPPDALETVLGSANLIAGDVNGDGRVEFTDFLVMSKNYGTPGQYTSGDLNKDGQVSFPDFLIMSNNFGQSIQTMNASSVPEPEALALLVIGLCGIGLRRKR